MVERPDVVLLDVNMPRLDGFEVCRRLKANPATRLIPVVLLTGLAAVEDRVRGIDAGADDFLSKPYAAAELEARVRSLTRLKRYTDDLDSAESVILSLARTIEARDLYIQGHGAPLPDGVAPERACAELRVEVQRGWKDGRLVEAFIAVVPAVSATLKTP